MSRIRRVLHPTDFSRASAAAFKRAIDMARANKAEFEVLGIITDRDIATTRSSIIFCSRSRSSWS